MRDLSAGIWEKSLMKMVQESLDWSSYCFFFIFQKNDSQFPPTSSVLATICLPPVWKIDDDDYNVPVLTNSDKIIDKQENGPPCCLQDLTCNQWKQQNPYLLPGLRLKTLRSLSGDVSSKWLRNRPLPPPLWHNQPTHVAPTPNPLPDLPSNSTLTNLFHQLKVINPQTKQTYHTIPRTSCNAHP